MLRAERLNKITQIVNEKEIITIEELIDEIHSSKSTIRRDIETLCTDGLLNKTRGGAISVNRNIFTEPSIRKRSNLYIEEKIRIATAALKHIVPGERVILDSGSTLLEFAKLLKNIRDLTVVTYDIRVALEIAKFPSIDLMLTGGMFRKNYYSLHGYLTENMLSEIHVNKAFISADAVDLAHGLISSYTTEDIGVKKQIINAADEVILLCDHSKFETGTFVNVGELNSIHTIITGKEINESILLKLKELPKIVDVV